jgi:hypothetical protein
MAIQQSRVTCRGDDQLAKPLWVDQRKRPADQPAPVVPDEHESVEAEVLDQRAQVRDQE